jgi:hypothetical protein
MCVVVIIVGPREWRERPAEQHGVIGQPARSTALDTLRPEAPGWLSCQRHDTNPIGTITTQQPVRCRVAVDYSVIALLHLSSNSSTATLYSSSSFSLPDTAFPCYSNSQLACFTRCIPPRIVIALYPRLASQVEIRHCGIGSLNDYDRREAIDFSFDHLL